MRRHRRAKAIAVTAAAATLLLGGVGTALAKTAHVPHPNRHLTPGVAYSGFTAAMVCSPTFKISPVATKTAKKVFSSYHIAWAKRGHYELDLLIPSSLGGRSTVKNLWPQQLSGSHGAYVKDNVDSTLHSMVCSKKITLAAAQQAETSDWATAVSRVIGTMTTPPPAQLPVPVPTVTVKVPGPTVTVTKTVTVTPTPTPTSTVTYSQTWGAGTHQIGSDIPAGRYTASGGSNCIWYISKGSSVIGNGAHEVVPVVSLAATNTSFTTNDGCGRWHAYAAPATPSTAFGDGTHVDGKDIAYATYTAPGGPYCYWQRVNILDGAPSSVAASGTSTTSVTVTLQHSDSGFKTSSCGNWIKTS
jgi:hypothetical protein